MKTEVIKQFSITITCDEYQANVIVDALHKAYRPIKDKEGYRNPEATILREARDAFATATGRHYMGEDA